jgi:transcriptional regulator
MYLPASFRVEDQAQIEAFLRRHDFGTVVSAPAAGMVATHLPLVVRREPAGLVVTGHVARANPHWKLMDGQGEALVIFQGPHGYVSPTWYPAGPAVPPLPTWNYTVVHAHGRPRAVDEPAVVRALMAEIVARYEESWRMDDLPAEFIARMVAAVVAFEMPVERLEAKFKLGQNRGAEDRASVINGLRRAANPGAAALAAFMEELEGQR